jgi:hypothetical protein
MVAAFPAFSQLADSQAQAASAGTHALTKIDLVFSGGSPLELIAAIQKSLGRPINVVIPDRASSLRIPAYDEAGGFSPTVQSIVRVKCFKRN